jgi:RND family efflux transporter MFP subunit
MKLLLRILIPIVVLAGAGYGTFILVGMRPAPPTRVFEPVVPLVETIDVVLGTVALHVHAEGTVAPRVETELVPEVAGRVLELSPSLVVGGFFDEGDVLFRLDAREYELAVIRSRAAIAQANLRLETEQQEASVAEREWELLDIGQPTGLALRVPQIAEALASLASAEATLAQAEYDLERTVVRAPYDGRVRTERLDIGQFVQRGNSVATLYSIDAAEVRLPIPDAELAFVDLPLGYRDGDVSTAKPTVTIRAQFAGEAHEWVGQIDRTEGEIDLRTRMVNAIARVEDPYSRVSNPDRPPLAIGMFVEADILGRSSGQVAALPRSVLRGANQVLVVDSDNTLRFKTVEVFRLERDRVLLDGGIEEGDRIVVSPLESAVEGMAVRVQASETIESEAD